MKRFSFFLEKSYSLLEIPNTIPARKTINLSFQTKNLFKPIIKIQSEFNHKRNEKRKLVCVQNHK